MTPAPQIGQEHYQSQAARGSYAAHFFGLFSPSHKQKVHTPQTSARKSLFPFLQRNSIWVPKDGCTMMNPWCWRNHKAPQLCESPSGWEQSSLISSKPFSRDTHMGSVSVGYSVILNPWTLPCLNQIVLDYAAKRSRFIITKKWHLSKGMGWFDRFL